MMIMTPSTLVDDDTVVNMADHETNRRRRGRQDDSSSIIHIKLWDMPTIHHRTLSLAVRVWFAYNFKEK